MKRLVAIALLSAVAIAQDAPPRSDMDGVYTQTSTARAVRLITILHGVPRRFAVRRRASAPARRWRVSCQLERN